MHGQRNIKLLPVLCKNGSIQNIECGHLKRLYQCIALLHLSFDISKGATRLFSSLRDCAPFHHDICKSVSISVFQ